MIAVIDYGVGNLFSVEKALLKLGAEVTVTSDASQLRQADKIVLPGVGAFGDCMHNLQEAGLVPVVRDIAQSAKPLLGICVGFQILFEGSEESPGVAGLGIFKGMVQKIQASGLKIPHMGWNSLSIASPRQSTDLFRQLPAAPYVYFVHSYHAVPTDPAVITAATEYGSVLTAAVAQGNVQATQFHPEKSGDVGLHILQNFLEG